MFTVVTAVAKNGRGKQTPGRVQVRYWQVNCRSGYDVRVLSPEASVADYMQALATMDISRLYRPYNPGRACLGCDHCCGGRLPLTIIDLYELREGLRELTGKELSLPEILAGYCQAQVNGGVVDITLRIDAEGYCIFLEPRQRRCRLYEYRPLICRTFFCSPLTRRARVLREVIVNRGEDELVRCWLSIFHRLPAGVKRADCQPTPFATAGNYSYVTLRSFCSPQLWRQLYQPAGQVELSY